MSCQCFSVAGVSIHSWSCIAILLLSKYGFLYLHCVAVQLPGTETLLETMFACAKATNTTLGLSRKATFSRFNQPELLVSAACLYQNILLYAQNECAATQQATQQASCKANFCSKHAPRTW